jgi:hypothetical protein
MLSSSFKQVFDSVTIMDLDHLYARRPIGLYPKGGVRQELSCYSVSVVRIIFLNESFFSNIK